jgi:TetR/AcrR family transcriptional regulator, transcriptional repressor for nem operon
MAAPRRVGAEKSETRFRLLDCVEELMVEAGYAAVTYRAVAARAGVTPGLVQYYFPALDDLLVATIRRRSEQGLTHLARMLKARPSQPLRVLWEFSNDETSAALTMEFSALGNHRKSVRAEIVSYTNQLRAVQLEALAACPPDAADAPEISPAALLFLLSGIPKLVRMEEDFEVHTGHAAILELVERYIESVEPSATGT